MWFREYNNKKREPRFSGENFMLNYGGQVGFGVFCRKQTPKNLKLHKNKEKVEEISLKQTRHSSSAQFQKCQWHTRRFA
jgi:hypothetical protein